MLYFQDSLNCPEQYNTSIQMNLWPVEPFCPHFFSRSVLIWKKVRTNGFNWSEIHLYGSNFLQNPYFKWSMNFHWTRCDGNASLCSAVYAALSNDRNWAHRPCWASCFYCYIQIIGADNYWKTYAAAAVDAPVGPFSISYNVVC